MPVGMEDCRYSSGQMTNPSTADIIRNPQLSTTGIYIRVMGKLSTSSPDSGSRNSKEAG